MNGDFIEQRKKAGDVVFVNRYDAESVESFCRLIDRFVAREKGVDARTS